MTRTVTFEEFTGLKKWMVSHFATKEEVLPRLDKLEQDVALLKYDLSELKIDFKSFKQEMIEFKNETITRFDKVFGFLEKLDQERIFTHEAILRIEEKLEKPSK